jgi:predicted nucleic acid-binding protein
MIYDAIRKIGELARAGIVTLYDSDETLAEFLNFRPTALGMANYDLLSDVQIRHARAPISRGFTIDVNYSPRRAREKWKDYLAHIEHPRFRELLRFVAPKHAADVYHLWEAEHNGIDAFITLDNKFVNATTKPKPIASPVKIFMPAQFVEWMSQKTGAPGTGS